MAKRRRTFSLDKLVSRLSALDEERRAIVEKLRTALSTWSGENPFPWQIGRKTTGVARKKRKLSAKARKAISDAQKRRWAEQRKKAAEK